MMQENIKDTWFENLGTYLPHVLLFGSLVLGITKAIDYRPALPFQSQHSSTITVTKNMMKIDGKDIPIITSEFTPNGKFTIGKPFKDPMTSVTAYPFLISSWQSMPNSNPLKARIQSLEKRTGETQEVAYSVHAGKISYGCVVLPARLNEISNILEGRQIEIKTREG